MKFLKEHKLEILIFFVAFFIQLAAFFLMIQQEGVDVFSESDAKIYIQIAKNILNYKVFSWSQEMPLIPDSFRMPLYPLFLAFIFSFTSKIWFVSIIHNILSAATCVLIFLIGKKVFNQKVGLLAAFILALEPHRAVYSNFVLTEPLFTFFLVVTIYFFIDFLKFDNKKSFYVSVVFLGLFILTKPIAQYSWLIFFWIALVKILVQKVQKIEGLGLKQIVLAGFLLFLILLPWLIRNEIVFNHFALNSSRNFNLYHWYVPIIYAKQHNIPRSDTIHLFYEKTAKKFPSLREEHLHNFEFSSYFHRKALEIISSDPLGYLKLHLVGSSYFFLTTGYRSKLMRLFGIPGGEMTVDPISLLSNYGLKGIIDYINLIVIFGLFLILIINFFFWINIFFIKKSENWLSELLLYIFIFYFALLIGPLASAASKYPVQPFIILLASLGFFRLRDFIRPKYKAR